MYLTSEESRNSLSDESIYSETTTDLISFKEEENNASIRNRIRPKRKREKLDHLSNEEKEGVRWANVRERDLSLSQLLEIVDRTMEKTIK